MEETGKESLGKSTSEKKSARPFGTRQSLNRAVRIDWERVSFMDEEWEEESPETKPQEIQSLESADFGRSGEPEVTETKPVRKKSARPAHLAGTKLEIRQNQAQDEKAADEASALLRGAVKATEQPETGKSVSKLGERLARIEQEKAPETEMALSNEEPADTTPSDTTPSNTIPEDTDPLNTVPSETVPSETVSSGTLPSEAVSTETGKAGEEDMRSSEPVQKSSEEDGAPAVPALSAEQGAPKEEASETTGEMLSLVESSDLAEIMQMSGQPETETMDVPGEPGQAEAETVDALPDPVTADSFQEDAPVQEVPSGNAEDLEEDFYDEEDASWELDGQNLHLDYEEALEEEGVSTGQEQETYDGEAEYEDKRVQRKKSARPYPVNYVRMPEEEFVYNPPVEEEPKQKLRKKSSRIFAAMAACAAIAAYAGVSYYFVDHFIPGTRINGVDCAGKTAYEAEQILAESMKDYTIQIASRGNDSQVIKGNEIGYRYLSDGEVLGLLKKQKPYAWITGFFGGKKYTTAKNVTFDKALLQSQLRSLDCALAEKQEKPQDAYITMVEGEFQIVPETEGRELNVREAYQALDSAVSSSQEVIDFTSLPDVYESAQITKDSEAIHSMLDAYNNYARANITYTFGNQTEVLNGDTIKTWLDFDENGQLLTDGGLFMQHIQEYVEQLAAKYDTVGTNRSFRSSDGRVVEVYSYAYGWMIDQEEEAAQLQQDIMSGATVTREPIYAMTANAHGEDDIGDTYIEVDLGSQHMYYYQNGYIIFDSDFVSGDITIGDRATPEGIYTLYFKQSPAVLRGSIDESTGRPEYETEVTYWMPFNGGIGFHDADWQPYFGGDRFVGGGSHGCINLPYYAAAELYNIIEYDVPIICFY